MLESFPTYSVHVHRLDPMLAELHIQFHDLPPDVEVSGRVIGPRCVGVTIFIATVMTVSPSMRRAHA